MKTNEINIRDPFLLLHEGKYYLYGTRSATCWGEADGFDCYVSADRENWDGPFEIFHRPDGFWADRAYWAPECVHHDGAFFLITTLGASDRKKGIYDSYANYLVFCPACSTPIKTNMYLQSAETYLEKLRADGARCPPGRCTTRPAMPASPARTSRWRRSGTSRFTRRTWTYNSINWNLTRYCHLIRHDFVVPPSPQGEGKGYGAAFSKSLPLWGRWQHP